jgi:hypothetical protein
MSLKSVFRALKIISFGMWNRLELKGLSELCKNVEYL